MSYRDLANHFYAIGLRAKAARIGGAEGRMTEAQADTVECISGGSENPFADLLGAVRAGGCR